MRTLIDRATLRRAQSLAAEWRVPVPEVLISLGWVEESDYVRTLADELALEVITADGLKLSTMKGRAPGFATVVAGEVGGHAVTVVEARGFAPDVLRAFGARNGRGRLALASRRTLLEAAVGQRGPAMLDRAVNDLSRRAKSSSSRGRIWLWQSLCLAALFGLALGGLLAAPQQTVVLLSAALAAPFLCVIVLRLAALMEVLQPGASEHQQKPSPTEDDANAAHYTVMVALHREAEALPGLVHALAALDYPAARLQILLVLEEDDIDTVRVARGLDLPGNFEIVLVPAGGPRTKPKALNWALDLVRGEFLAVYDAEDIPEPDQIRRALAVFRCADARVACVQARLNIHNSTRNWLTRQFALEYSALFDAILPALERFGLVVPLGGTSNHFRVAQLRAIGAWDPYNVTEDADLGFRIARAGLRTITIASTTWEEAPVELGNWLKQRTRWLKGWMQTYLVHTRQPLRLLRELGLWRSLGLNILMGGILLSVLVHPFCYLLLGAALVSGHALEAGATSWEAWLWWVAAFNLAAGYATSMMVAAVAVARRGLLTLALHVVFMPVYWLLISVAGYRALIQLVRAPHVWEKTKHGASPASLGGVPDMIDWTALARYRGKLGDCLRQRP